MSTENIPEFIPGLIVNGNSISINIKPIMDALNIQQMQNDIKKLQTQNNYLKRKMKKLNNLIKKSNNNV